MFNQISWEQSKFYKYSTPAVLQTKFAEKQDRLNEKLIRLLDVLSSEKKVKAKFKGALAQEDRTRFLDLLLSTGLFSPSNLISQKGAGLLNAIEKACESQNEAFAIALIKRGVPPKNKAWTLARKLDQPDLLTVMVEQAAHLRPYKELLELYDWSFKRHHTGLSKALLLYFLNYKPYVDPLFRAAVEGDLDQIKMIVDQQNRWGMTGQTALQLAYAAGHDDVVEVLMRAQGDRLLRVVTPKGKVLAFFINSALFSARSKYFETQLDAKWRDNTLVIREIKDLELCIQMLAYLYTDHLPIDPFNLPKIIEFADKFYIKGVKEKCAEWLLENPGQFVSEKVLSPLEHISALRQCGHLYNPEETELRTKEDYFKKWLTSEEIEDKDVHHACRKGWVEALRFMQRRGVQELLSLNSFFEACDSNHLETIKFILDERPKSGLPQIGREHIIFGLKKVCKKANEVSEEMAIFLLSQINELTWNDFADLTGGSVKIFRLMLSKLTPEARVEMQKKHCFSPNTNLIWYPLRLLKYEQIIEIFKLLIQEGVDVTFASDLDKVIKRGLGEVVKLNWSQIAPDKKHSLIHQRESVEKIPALIETLQPGDGGDEELAEMLIRAGADVAVTTTEGLNPLYLAVRAGWLNVVKLILAELSKISPEIKREFLNRPVGHLQRTPLIAACLIGSRKRILSAINSSENSLESYSKNWTYANVEGEGELAQLLIQEGAVVTATTTNGCTALYYAAKNGLLIVAQQILERIPPEERELFLNKQGGKNKMTALSAAFPNPGKVKRPENPTRPIEGPFAEFAFKDPKLVLRSRMNRQKLAQRLLDEGASVSLSGSDGSTPLFYAARAGFAAIAAQILQKSDPLKYLNQKAGKDQTTPLIESFCFGFPTGSEELPRLLLKKGADASLSAGNGMNALAGVAFSGSVELAEEILAKIAKPERAAFINQSFNQYEMTTALMLALYFGNRPVSLFLVQNGALLWKEGAYFFNELCLAVRRGWEELVEPLVDKMEKTPPEKKGFFLNAALLTAFAYHHLEIAKKLLQLGADVTFAEEGLTALHLAVLEGHEDVVDLIFKHVPEDKLKDFVNQTTTVQQIFDPGFPHDKFTTQAEIDEIRRKFEEMPDELRSSPIILRQTALPSRLRKETELLNEKNFELRVTPLQLALDNGSEGIIQLLKDAGAV